MMNNDFILSKLGEVRRNAFIIEFELGLLTHNLVLSGNAKIDTGCENTSIALQSPSIGIDKRTAFAYKKQAIEANLNMSLGFGANDTKCSEGSREICSGVEISQTALCLNLMCLLRSIASRL